MKAALLFLLACAAAIGGEVTLSWGGGADAAAYRVYYGDAPGRYEGVAEFPEGATNGTVCDLAAGRTWYFVLCVQRPSGIESDPSAEVSCYVPRWVQVGLVLESAESVNGPWRGVSTQTVSMNATGQLFFRGRMMVR